MKNDNKLYKYKSYKPFSDELIMILDETSKLLFKTETYRNELIPLAFELRKQNLLKQRELHPDCLPRGVVLFICPKNVDLISCYALAYGILCGNYVVIRPSLNSELFLIFTNYLKKVCDEHFFSELLDNILILDSLEEEPLKYWSEKANARIAWGSNNSIESYLSMKKNRDCKDVFFAHRNSLALINCEYKEDFDLLVESFYKSSFLYDQLSCSSPRAVYFINARNDFIKLFWEKLYEYAKQETKFNDTKLLLKYSNLCQLLAHQDCKVKLYDNILYVIESKIFDWTKHKALGNGTFFSFKASSLRECLINLEQIQTISFWGIDKRDIIEELLLTNNSTVTRVLPINRTLEFDNVVDGEDLFFAITRKMKY